MTVLSKLEGLQLQKRYGDLVKQGLTERAKDVADVLRKSGIEVPAVAAPTPPTPPPAPPAPSAGGSAPEQPAASSPPPPPAKPKRTKKPKAETPPQGASAASSTSSTPVSTPLPAPGGAAAPDDAAALPRTFVPAEELAGALEAPTTALSTTMYLLFGGRKGYEGGASDFLGAYSSVAKAEEAGLAHPVLKMGGSPCMHIGAFDGMQLRVERVLSVPTNPGAAFPTLRWWSGDYRNLAKEKREASEELDRAEFDRLAKKYSVARGEDAEA